MNQRTPVEITRSLAERLRRRRKECGLSQGALSVKSGVSLGSLKRFELTGEIALLSFVKIAIALGCDDELSELFTKKRYSSIQEIINEQA